MHEAKRRGLVKVLATGLFLLGFAIGGCGGRISTDADLTALPDAGAPADDGDASAAPPPSGFDASAFECDGGAPGFPPVPNGPRDTEPACASRTPLDCSCKGEDCPKPPDSYFGELAVECAASFPACGPMYVDFDVDGCAIDLRMDNPDPKFVACLTEKLDAQRWLCEAGGGGLFTNLDCTVP